MIDEIKFSYLKSEFLKAFPREKFRLICLKGVCWFENYNGKIIEDAAIIGELSSPPKDGYRKNAKLSVAFFWLNDNKTVLEMHVPKNTHAQTLKNYLESFRSHIEISGKHFYANHDALTGVLNRNGLIEGIRKSASRPPKTTKQSLSKSIVQQELFGLNSFDLDHFKQINDSFGHEAGDNVLQIFSSRVFNAVKALEGEYSADFFVGRPGGEEFEVIVLGDIDAKTLRKITEEISGRLKSLPNESEWKDISPQTLSSQSSPRQVTASIGFAIKPITDQSILEKIYTELRSESDKAVYKAKADGRNCTIFYGDIKNKHGRVYECHSSLGLIMIDIGESVGVAVGEKFKVFSPPFNGGKITKSDERSSKVVGFYPTVESGEILVIHTQNEYSTCIPVKKHYGGSIVNGALLNYCASGTPSAMPERGWRGVCGADSFETLNRYVEKFLSEKAIECVVRIESEFYNDSNGLEDKAPTFIYIKAKNNYRIFSTGYGTYYLIATKVDGKTKQGIRNDINSYLADINEVVKIRAGVVFLSSIPKNAEVTSGSLLYYSAIALAAAKEKEDHRYHTFGSQTAERMLFKWRQRRSPCEAIEEYRKIKNYGISSPSVDNQFALALKDGDRVEYAKEVELAFLAAAQGEDSLPLFQANLALFQAECGKFSEAYETFSHPRSQEIIDGGKYSNSYILGYAKTVLEIYRSSNPNAVRVIATKAVMDKRPPGKSKMQEQWFQELNFFLDSEEGL